MVDYSGGDLCGNAVPVGVEALAGNGRGNSERRYVIVIQNDYIHRTCPYCKSKRLRDVVIDPSNHAISTGHKQCQNCKRVYIFHETKWRLDRQQIRRDIAKLRKYLEKGLPKLYR